VSLPGYGFGPAAFDVWAGDVAAGPALRDGHSYSAEVWRECREMAVEFLREVEHRLPGRYGSALGEAARCYAIVRDKLRAVLDLHPFRHETWDPELRLDSPETAPLLREAGAAEREALEFLGQAASHRG